MYTIQFLKNDSSQADKVRSYLIETLSKDGRFKCEILSSHVKTSRSDRSDIFNKYNCKNVHSVRGLFLKKIRLNKAKQGHGYLTWDDWIEFNSFINKVLNIFKVYANVWSNPFGKFWIRKGLEARKIYDFKNNGTEDQF